MNKLFILFLAIASFASATEKKVLRFGLTAQDQILEQELNNALVDSEYSVLTVYLKGHDEKRNAVLQNNFDIIEGGFHSFYEFSKRREAKVLLHAWYFRDYSDDMFHISGNIITHVDNKISLSDISKMNIYARHDFSASGYYLQKLFLSSKNISCKAETFTNSSSKTIKAVEDDKNSVGFVPSFYKLPNSSKVKVIFQSQPYPGGLIFADKKIPEDIRNIISKITLQYFLKVHSNTIRGQKTKTHRMYVTPLHDDYGKMFFPNYKTKEQSYWQIATALLAILLVITVWQSRKFYIKYKYEHQQRIDQTADQIGITALLKEVKETLGDNQDLHEYFDDLTASLGDLSDDLHNKSIAQLTLHAEHLLKCIIMKLNEKLIQHGVPEIKGKRDDFNGNLDAFLNFCVAFNTAGSEIRKTITDQNMGAVSKMIHTPGLLKLLYFFRNPSHHKSEFWHPGKLHSHLTILSSLLLLQCVNESNLFAIED